MNFFISILCKKCLCQFQLCPDNFKERDSMECPNCGQPFPDDAFKKLKTGITMLGEIPESLPDSEFPSGVDSQFSLKMCEYHPVQKMLQ